MADNNGETRRCLAPIVGAGVASRLVLRSSDKTDGDCPDLAESSEQQGIVPFSEAAFVRAA
jgi:hypothetical protein